MEKDHDLEAIEEYFEKRRLKEQVLTLDDIVDSIIELYNKVDMLSFLFQGLTGQGKTTFALKISARFYARINRDRYEYYWKEALNHLYFDPLTLLSHIIKNIKKGNTIPLVILDDAGAWLSKWGLSSDKRGFLEFTNLLRETIGAIIYTDIFSIAKYIRDTVKIHGILEKLNYAQIRKLNLDTKKEWSMCKLYTIKMNIRGIYMNHLGDIVFPLELPKHVRREYRAKRRKYTADLAVRVLRRIVTTRRFAEELEEGRHGAVELMGTLQELVKT